MNSGRLLLLDHTAAGLSMMLPAFFFLPVPPLCVARVPSISYPSTVGLSPGLWGVITRVNGGSPHRPPVEKHSTDLLAYTSHNIYSADSPLLSVTAAGCPLNTTSCHTTSVCAQFVFLFRYDFLFKCGCSHHFSNFHSSANRSRSQM